MGCGWAEGKVAEWKKRVRAGERAGRSIQPAAGNSRTCWRAGTLQKTMVSRVREGESVWLTREKAGRVMHWADARMLEMPRAIDITN